MKKYPKEISQKLQSRFWKKVKKTSSCWYWIGSKTESGYGIISENWSSYRAHRISFILHYGEIPGILYVCHKCDRPSCVNPKHLFLGSQADNVKDAIEKRHHPFGNFHKNSKINSEDVIAIRVLRKRGIGMEEISNLFKLSQSNISKIWHMKAWRHVH